MKLLIITQKVDKDDSVLGFFHRWIIEMAKHYDDVRVITLYEGKHDLPKNVKVHSLGKESGESRLKYLRRFYHYIFSLRNEYDSVFIHQNQEYAILGGPLWKVWGKRVFMWRNHYAGSLLTDIAASFCTKIFCTSKFSYTAKYSKTVFMPVGIDTELFRPVNAIVRAPHSVLSLGRIATSKKIEQLIQALDILKKADIEFSASIYGDVASDQHKYYELLNSEVAGSGLGMQVTFWPGVANDRTPAIYSANEIFVNLSPSGMFDKTIFEAMLCGAIPLVCNKDLASQIDTAYIFKEDDTEDLAMKLRILLDLSSEERTRRGAELRKFAEENHGLGLLADRLVEAMATAQ